MLHKTLALTAVAVLAGACGTAPKDEAPAPAISMSAADNLVPGQLARGVALQTEIRSAGNECNKVVSASKEEQADGGDVWDAECEGGKSYRVISKADGTTDVEGR